MTDDLSKWRLAQEIPVPFGNWPKQTVYVSDAWSNNGSEAITVTASDEEHNNKYLSVAMSLDDAENFATLILYEVKRAKGEL